MNLVSMPISQLSTVQSGGGAPQDAAAFTKAGFPFVRAGSLPKLLDGAEEDSLELIEPEVADEYGLKLFPAGTVLFAKSGMSAMKGHVYRLKNPAYVVNHLAALIPREASDGAFLAHALQRYSPTILIKDPAYPSIRLGDIESMRIQAPTSPRDRERIAEILDKADALRTKRRAALAQLDTLTQCIFLDIFGDPVANPRRLPIAAMGEVCDVRDGTHDSPKYVSDGGFPLLTSKNVSGGTINLSEVNYISEVDYNQINKRSKVDRGDIILPMIGTIGSPVLVDQEPRFAIKNVALIKFTTKSPSNVFVHYLLSGHYFDHVVSRKNRGGTQKFVSLGDLRAFPLPIPPHREQAEFARRVEALGTIRSANRASGSLLNDLFAVLLLRSFRGELLSDGR